jgi:hypothetical protein
MGLGRRGQTDDGKRQSREQESVHDYPPSLPMAATLQAWLLATDVCDARRGAFHRRTNLGNAT